MTDASEDTAQGSRDSEAGPTLGQRLRQTREAQGLSLSDVAERLRFTKDRVTRMESDDYADTAALTYARGYLKTYAKLLGLPLDEAMEAFDRLDLNDRFTQPILHRRPAPKEMEEVLTSSRGHARWGSYGVIVALAVLVVLWWFGIKRPPQSSVGSMVVQKPIFSQVGVINETQAPSPSQPLVVTDENGGGEAETTPHFGAAIKVLGAGESGDSSLAVNSSTKDSTSHAATQNSHQNKT